MLACCFGSRHGCITSMMTRLVLTGLVIAMTMMPLSAVTPSREEFATVSAWMQKHHSDPPFSFTYGGKHSRELLRGWSLQKRTRRLDLARTEHTMTWTGDGLQVRWVAIEYRDFPTVEWTLYFRNVSKTETPILQDIQAIDITMRRSEKSEYVLNHNTGSPCTQTDYQPMRDVLVPDTTKRITTSGGRSSNSDLPYFNVEWQDEGMIIAIGWPGQWAAEFTRDDSNGLRVHAGQELTHLKLLPGEEIRSPLVVVQFWIGDRIRAQNIWRRWMLEHNTPRIEGRHPEPHLAACSSHQFSEMIKANEKNQKLFIDRYLDEGIKLDYWWMDAGWYVNDGSWQNTGTWEVDKKRFPNGLRAITDYAHERGVKSIVWFEPERVTPGTWLYTEHPEWLLGEDGEQKLLDMGNPEARKWLVEHVDRTIIEQGIDLYRQDFNIDPLPYWRANDAEDRQGITEIRYVEGFFAFWDELRRRHPNMLIDTCASGGRRNDIETLRRSVPLLRSDYILEPIGQQLHTLGIASWIPLYGTGLNQFDAYSARSCFCPFINACYDVRSRDSDWESVRRLISEWRQIAHYYLGDYYPLTEYSVRNDVWVAWQFHRADLDEGVIQAFRRADNTQESSRFRLRGLDPESTYQLTDLDTRSQQEVSASELMDSGLTVTLPTRPSSSVLIYRRRDSATR